MRTGEILEELKALSNSERLMIIETATRLVRNDLSALQMEESRLRASASALRELYEPGGELAEWSSLDSEDFLNDHVQG